MDQMRWTWCEFILKQNCAYIFLQKKYQGIYCKHDKKHDSISGIFSDEMFHNKSHYFVL